MALDYEGRYPVFDFRRIRTYPLAGRTSKVRRENLVRPEEFAARPQLFSSPELDAVVKAVAEARAKGQPVLLFTGAHLVKNGFGRLARDLLERNILTSVGMNAAGMIHDVELALVGRTSEDVPAALPAGEFGFAEETGALINRALTHGHALAVGAGEAVGRLLAGEPFPDPVAFPFRELSLIDGGWQTGRPVTIHAMIGTDVIDQHPTFDPAAKGACSGRDFAIFCAQVERMSTGGGVFLNVGSAVGGPEVFLKACSMSANVGRPPRGLVAASFDFRAARPEDVDDERKSGYYFRDLKSVVVRIPEAFGGRGYYVQGDHLRTVPALYQQLVRVVGRV